MNFKNIFNHLSERVSQGVKALSASKKVIFKTAVAAAFVAISTYFVVENGGAASFNSGMPTTLSALPIVTPNMRYGFNIDTFANTKVAKIASNESFADFVKGSGLTASQIDKINHNCEGLFDVRHFRTGREYMLLTRNNNTAPDFFCYSPDLFSHLVINLKTLEVNRVQLPVETRIEEASGVIESNIWNTMVDNGWNYDIIDRLEDALSCSVDFHHTDEGDKFKFIFENRYVNGKSVATGNLLAAYFTDGNKEYHAIWYDDGKIKGFFDAEGRPMKKTFLKSPVRFAHISSGFNMRRLHPVLRYVKPHLGTDFAAPTGTPIMAVADGTVSEATRRGGNGIYVKIRHDDKYETQYLHMCRHAKGIHPGTRVTQGQTIGYVGSTGLATGPHVCFRFWKNGTQCNFQKADLPAPQQMDKNSLPNYMNFKEGVIAKIKNIPYRSADELAAAKGSNNDAKP